MVMGGSWRGVSAIRRCIEENRDCRVHQTALGFENGFNCRGRVLGKHVLELENRGSNVRWCCHPEVFFRGLFRR
jgi:hypothetical protein